MPQRFPLVALQHPSNDIWLRFKKPQDFDRARHDSILRDHVKGTAVNSSLGGGPQFPTAGVFCSLAHLTAEKCVLNFIKSS
jgi:hypothetical protein